MLAGLDGPVMLRVFLVVGEQFCLMVDTAMVGFEGMVQQAVDTLNQLNRPLALILNTHAHHDHIGLNHWVQSKTGAMVGSHGWGREWIIDPDRNYQEFVLGHADLVPDSALLRQAVRETMGPGTNLNLEFYGGERIDLGGLTLEVVDLSGHLPGEIGVLVESQRTLIMGDAFTGLAMPFFHSHVSPQLYRTTLARVANLVDAGRVQLILSSHLPAWDGPEAILGAIAERVTELDRLDAAVLDTLAAGPKTLAEVWRAISLEWKKEIDFRGLNMVYGHLRELADRDKVGCDGSLYVRI